jgi:hypothetical protein
VRSTLVLYTDGLIESRAAAVGTDVTSLAEMLTVMGELTAGIAYAAYLVETKAPEGPYFARTSRPG